MAGPCSIESEQQMERIVQESTFISEKETIFIKVIKLRSNFRRKSKRLPKG